MGLLSALLGNAAEDVDDVETDRERIRRFILVTRSQTTFEVRTRWPRTPESESSIECP